MEVIRKFKKSQKGSITIMVLTAMLFMLVVITISYLSISNESIGQDKKIRQISEQYQVTDDDMEQEYQKVINNLKVEDYVTIGDYVDYNPTISTKDGTSVEENKLKYISPTGTATEHGNGHNSSEEGGVQTFTATSDIKWRVLNIEDGTIELISKYAIKPDEGNSMTIAGGIGYLYAEQELNEICKIYGYGYGADTTKGGTYTTGGPIDTQIVKKIENAGARSITIDDINKKAGIYKQGGTMRYSNGEVINDSYASNDNPTVDVYYPTVNGRINNGQSTLPGVQQLRNTYYSYDKSEIDDANIYEMIFNGNYWLSSRFVDTGETSAYLGVHCVDSTGVNTSNLCICYNSNFHGNASGGKGVRPIVSLKANVIDLSIDYNKDNIWHLK